MVLRWVAAGLLLLFVVLAEREPLSFLGIRRPSARDLLTALAVAAATIVIGGGLYLLIHGAGFAADTYHGQITSTLGPAGRLQVDINAAVLEELIFRGLLIERLTRLTRRPWLAALASFVLFVGSHYASGSASLIETLTATTTGGIALVGLYMWRRNLPATMLAHAIMDIPNVVITF